MQAPTKKSRPAYAWLIVLAAFLCFGVVYGTVLYSYTVFVNPVAKAFGVSTTQVALGFTVLNVGTGLLGMAAGPLLAKMSLRNGIVAGLVLLAAGFLLLSFATALWQFFLLYGVLVAFASIVVAPLGASAIVANWFHAGRGRALTLSTLGTSFGQLLIPAMAAQIMERAQWSGAYQAFAVLLVIVAVPIFFIVVDHPDKLGLRAHGAEQDAAAGEPAVESRLTNMQILGAPHFWIIAGAYIFTVVVYLAVTATIVPYARTFGVSGLQASRLVVVMGLASIVGKLGFAAWTDRIGLRNTLWVATALNLASVILLASVQGYGVLFVASACTGASAGGILPVWPGLVAERFGRFNLPRAMGLMSPIVVSLQGFGAPIVTALHFRPAFVWFIGVLLLSGLLGFGLSKPAPSYKSQAQTLAS